MNETVIMFMVSAGLIGISSGIVFRKRHVAVCMIVALTSTMALATIINASGGF